MNGIHDMGGMHGFGPIETAKNEPVFHEEWEGRVLAMFKETPVRMPGIGRARIESLDPAFYLASSYYEKWLHAEIRGLLEAGTFTWDEFEAKLALYQAHPELDLPAPNPAQVEESQAAFADSAASGEESADITKPAFSVGNRVRARNIHPTGHTRLPGYVRGKVGEVAALYRPQLFQDAEPLSDHDGLQPVYAVRFDGREIWGPAAEPNSSVMLDMWESYLALERRI